MQISPPVILALYSLLVVVASVAGGWLPTIWSWNHRIIQGVMSFVGGVMLGIAVLHLLPHSEAATHSTDQTALATLIGLVTIFLLIRVFRVHQHPNYPGECEHDEGHHVGRHWHDVLDDPIPAATEYPPHGRKPGRVEHNHEDESIGSAPAHRLSWVGLFVGMAIHTMLDGIALAAAVASVSHGHPEIGAWGLGTFLAVFLHKPLDALSITSLMVVGGWSKRWQMWANWAFALICPAAAWLFYLAAGAVPAHQVPLVGWALGFSAGVFLCISLADILPEIQFHAHDRLLLTFLLLSGIAVAWLLGFLEPHQLHAH